MFILWINIEIQYIVFQGHYHDRPVFKTVSSQALDFC